MTKTKKVDLFIIGGGINGAAIARDAIGRGLSVMLAEKHDYASATSSASSKLIHGGLRYLEQYNFFLVRESLKEREVMMNIAPHLVTPLTFHIPIMSHHSRPSWFIRLGLFIYDTLSGSRKLSASGRLSETEMKNIPHLRRKELRAVMHYSDCQVDDARLTLCTLMDARRRGADISNYRDVVKISEKKEGYEIKYKENNELQKVSAQFIINTAGPWVNEILDKTDLKTSKSGLRLVRGSHIVLSMPDPPHKTATTLQNSDGRVVFTLPWLRGKFLVIGTTDAPHPNPSQRPECTREEMEYLLDIYNKNFTHPGGPANSGHVVWTWSGVRSLADDGKADPSKITRSARIVANKSKTGGFISVYGGKLTTHRRLAEKVMNKLSTLGANLGSPWTSNAPLYGGELNHKSLQKLAVNAPEEIDKETFERWVYTYGSQVEKLLNSHSKKKIGSLYESELVYAHRQEDAITAEDFLYRRTKMGLFLAKKDIKAIENWFQNQS